MKLSMTLYINHTLEAVEFYQKAFGLTLGYHEKFPDAEHTYMQSYKEMGRQYLPSAIPNQMR